MWLVVLACQSNSTSNGELVTSVVPTLEQGAPSATTGSGSVVTETRVTTPHSADSITYKQMPLARHDDGFEAEITVKDSPAPRFDGPLRAIAIIPGTSDDNAYIAIGPNIHLANLTDPENIEIGEIVTRSDSAFEQLFAFEDLLLGITESHCYKFSCGELVVFQIDSRFGLTELTQMSGAYRTLDVEGDYLYLLAQSGEVDIYEMGGGSDFDRIATIKPPRVGGQPDFEFTTTDIDVESERIYLSLEPRHLVVYDVSSPSSPVLRSVTDLTTDESSRYQAQAVAASGNTVLVGGQDPRPSVIRVDVTDSANPTIDHIEDLGLGSQYFDYTNLEIVKGRVYYSGWLDDWVSFWFAGVLDISDQAGIEHIGTVQRRESVGVGVSTGEYLFLPAWDELAVVRVASVDGHMVDEVGDPITAAVMTTLPVRSTPTFVHLNNPYAFVFSPEVLRTFSTADDILVELGTVRLTGRAPVRVEDEIVYFLAGRSSVKNEETFARLDISDPMDPGWMPLIDSVWYSDDAPSATEDCPKTGLADVCYTTNPEPRGTQFLRVKQPGSDGKEFPWVLVPGGVGLSGADLTTAEEMIFVVSGDSFYVYSAEDPHEPVLMARLPLEGPTPKEVLEQEELEGISRSVKIGYQNGRVYLLADGFWAIDVLDPRAPRVLGYLSTRAIEFDVDGNNAVLVNESGKIEFAELVFGG